ncbi:oxygen-dependent tRNA uridine(34) hydroxylase TrhO [Tsukamurella spumae]|uniref:tRNA uridine(34) hydroxylase n=1 Tax=Tsukamurella spumae TaxID=44753 RepID=A0A846X5Y3_9ACTN|nr:rhodanese-related sulfurtransferase [Tsukamurella spumae]NKY19602.1 rhodanese-related sulfurtransferase [Tsukamurella spumae]
MGKIVLFYVFAPLADPDAIRLWQRALCEANDLRGRIIVSRHGINVTVGGEIRAVKWYLRATREYPAFKGADVKWSEGSAADFPKLSVKVRDEIVTFGVPDELEVDDDGVRGGGVHLTPDEVHAFLAERPDAVFFDGRNAIEAEIGRFSGAVVTPARTTRDFVTLLDSGEYDHLKDRPVITYCTGGVRCEVLSAVMRTRGFGEVYQLDGGIARYGERFGDGGLWEGSMYVFDRRMSVDFSDGAKRIGRCAECGTPTSRIANLAPPQDRELAVLCEGCAP